MNNIFIIGPVASGKNTLLDMISNDYDVVPLDTGKLFRFISYKLCDELKKEFDLDHINYEDKDEIDKITDKIHHLSIFIQNQFNNLKCVDGKFYYNDILLTDDDLYSKNTNSLLPIIASIGSIRNKVLKYVDALLSTSDKSIIMTGHNIKEIDTTKCTVVFLDVDEKESTKRLYNRNNSSYESIEDAYKEVYTRNMVDRIDNTKKLLPYLYNYIYIDTTNKLPDEVYLEFIDKIYEKKKIFSRFTKKQEKSIKSKNFDWLLNPILVPIIVELRKNSEPIISNYPFINQNDLIYQTIILLCAHDINELYNYSDKEYLKSFSDNLNDRDKESFDRFTSLVKNKTIRINYDIVLQELLSATKFLLEMYSSKETRKILYKYNLEQSKGNIKSSNGLIFDTNNFNDEKIEIRVIDSEMSNFIARNCHYLHTPRKDEYIAYGAFRNDEEYPIAYVSYSKQDRDYKKQLIYNLGIEPQNTIEMTRAWCSNSAPTNIMSFLFNNSISDISNKWQELSKIGSEDKYLQAVTTTINPNLGFKAHSFLGCNFIPIAMRPAKFTYVEKNGIIRYETRRSIESQVGTEEYFENKINVLPLNEMILCRDKNRLEFVKNSNVLLIDKNEYDSVLDNKQLVKKRGKNE